jgi:hypothetical protein
MTDGEVQEYPLNSLHAARDVLNKGPLMTEGEAQGYPLHSGHGARDILNKVASNDGWSGTGLPSA